MRYCVFCGVEIPDDAKFCQICGKKQPQSQTAEETKATEVSGEEDSESVEEAPQGGLLGSAKKMILVGVVSFAVMIGLITVVIIFVMK